MTQKTTPLSPFRSRSRRVGVERGRVSKPLLLPLVFVGVVVIALFVGRFLALPPSSSVAQEVSTLLAGKVRVCFDPSMGEPRCGDCRCSKSDGESIESCSADCTCGNLTCDSGETKDSCPGDCEGHGGGGGESGGGAVATATSAPPAGGGGGGGGGGGRRSSATVSKSQQNPRHPVMSRSTPKVRRALQKLAGKRNVKVKTPSITTESTPVRLAGYLASWINGMVSFPPPPLDGEGAGESVQQNSIPPPAPPSVGPPCSVSLVLPLTLGTILVVLLSLVTGIFVWRRKR